MYLIALAIAPGIAISLFIYSLRSYDKGPRSQLLITFLLGMVATVPAYLLQTLTADVRVDPGRHSILSFVWFAFVAVAFSEEGCKFLVLRIYAFPRKAFQEPFDGIVFAVMAGMGFATVENIEYVLKFGAETALSRFFLSVPAHASFAVLMGYHLGLAKRAPQRAAWLMTRGLLIAVLLHGSFDFFLFLQQNWKVRAYLSTGVLSFGAFASFYIAVRLALRAIRMHRFPRDEPETEHEESRQNTNFD
jgi:RsiW-degrading membrane proteinase PrsW (M82 family)